MDEDRYLRRKWVLHAADQKAIFIKGPREKSEHVYMKIFIWALYLPTYPDMSIERRIGDRYKPDVVSLDNQQKPLFWGESGQVGKEKIEKLARRYPHTHFAIAKWQQNIDPLEVLVQQAVKGVKRTAPFDLLRFNEDSVPRFIDEEGYAHPYWFGGLATVGIGRGMHFNFRKGKRATFPPLCRGIKRKLASR